MMIFGVALANITHKLDSLRQKDRDSGISSHIKLKEEGLACLKAIIEEAPTLEYLRFFGAQDHGLILAYTLNLLCHYSKNDKSRSIRQSSLNIMMSLMNRLENIHGMAETRGQNCCSIRPVVSALPGMSSSLFQLIMSDTKLPRSLFVIAIKNLSKLISIAFLSCDHQKSSDPIRDKSPKEETKEICDNLAIRLNFLIDYSMNNAAELPEEMLVEVLYLCNSIASDTSNELLLRSMESIVKYLAFMSSDNNKTPEVKLKIMLITDSIKQKAQDCDDTCERLDSVMISSISKVLDNLETNAFLMLTGERQSQLAILLGFFKLLPGESLTTFLELEDRRKQLINVLIELSEFAASQPFLLLTDSEVSEDAIEISSSKIYTLEKRFKHLSAEEINLVKGICQIIGFSTDWHSLNDILLNDLRKFSSPSNMYITYLILRGLLDRKLNSSRLQSMMRFTSSMLIHYIDSTQEEYTKIEQDDKEKILVIVIAIESLATLVEIHLEFIADKSLRIVILKDLLCPMLKWASSSSRAISEAALTALTQISQLYKYDSTKSLIEANIDYIVNGVMQMLENFSHNCDVTHVLAITFKLSSQESFYYFRDVFERLFRVLAIYQHTEKAQSIVLLFYRTLSTFATNIEVTSVGSPLENEAILMKVLYDLNIDRRIYDLNNDRQFHDLIERAEKAAPQTSDEMDNTDSKDEKVQLTKKILTLCIPMISSDYPEIKILALKTATIGFKVLQQHENTLLPLVHKLWSPLEKRLVGDYSQNLEVSLCAFECLVSMAENAKDFIKRRTLDSIIPRICLFLESQVRESLDKKDYGPYAMTVKYKCQLKILTHLGALAYHIELAYSNLWRVVRTTLLYLAARQMQSLRNAAKISLHYMIALDTDCVWFYSKQSNHQADLPFHMVFEQ